VNVDEFIDGLSAEAGEAVRRLLRQAYDSGFREALASAGQPQTPEPIASVAPPAPAPVAAPVEWAGGAEEGVEDASGDERDEGEDDDGVEETPAPRPILANAKVGTLRRRIIRTFDLERFDIDVVICRSGDPDRRQLKSSARLGLYRRVEG
jgi:hypothetical protein